LAAVIRDPAANATLLLPLGSLHLFVDKRSAVHTVPQQPLNNIIADKLDDDRAHFSIPIITVERAACLDFPGRRKEMQKSQATAHR
jgi:hypothetical protein